VHDFYILAGTVIPVLALTSSLTLVVSAPGTPGSAEETELDAFLRKARRIMAVLMLPVGGVMIWAEWVGLRSLELGHSAFGGPMVVWATLGYLGIGVVLMHAWAVATREPD
jgi:hypothetical protein